MPEHNALTGASLHEPKGVATAGAGEVYIADGAGSGTWTPPSNSISTRVLVTSASDLATLTTGTEYVIIGAVAISNQIVLPANCVVRGLGKDISSLVYAGTDDMFVGVNDNVVVKDLTLTANSQTTGMSIFNVSATTDGHTLVVEDVTCTVCDSFINSDRVSTTVSRTVVEDYTTKAVELTNNIALLSLKQCTFTDTDAGAVALDYGTATVTQILLSETVFAGLGTGVSGTASSANIASGYVAEYHDMDLSNMATPLDTITVKDVGHNFVRCKGVDPSRTTGQGYIEGNAAATVIADVGSGNAVLVNFNSSFNEDTTNTSRTTVSNNGRITNNGRRPVNCLVTANVYAAISGGVAKDFLFVLAKNGTINLNTSIKRTFDGTNSSGCTVTGVLTLDPTDYVELYTYQDSAAAVNITVDTCSLSLVEL